MSDAEQSNGQVFDLKPRPRLVLGPGSAERVGLLARERGASAALLVTDPGIVAAGHARRVHDSLRAAGLTVHCFEEARENPTEADVEACVDFARGKDFDLFVGLGGGSSIDTARGCNYLLTNGGQIRDYRGFGKAEKPMLPLIAIPTTSGTGSEVQSFALIADPETHEKMACGDPKALACIAILDPLLTLTQPREVTANTGLDALTHAVETAVTRNRNPLSLLYSHEAFGLVQRHLQVVLEDPGNIEARGAMQLGAAFAGLAIENSMLGAAHAAGNPLTATYDIVHGQAVALMLPWIIRFNAEDGAARGAYFQLARHASLVGDMASDEQAVAALLRRIEELLELAGVAAALEAHGVKKETLGALADHAAEQWTARFNPRDIGHPDFARIYQEAYHAP